MIIYRVKQFWNAIHPCLSPQEITWIKDVLKTPALNLFFQQSKSEQRHALDVANGLRRLQLELTSKEHTILLTGALLHDCGKSLHRIHLWQRIFIVVSQYLPKHLYDILRDSSTSFAFPLELAANHAKWGEDLARISGLDNDICMIIAEHHDPVTKLGKLLQIEDNKH